MSGGVNPGALLPSTKKSWLLVFYVCVGGGERSRVATAHVWESQDNLQEAALSFRACWQVPLPDESSCWSVTNFLQKF